MFDIKNYYLFLERAGLDSKRYQEEGVRWCLDNEINGKKIENTIYRGGLLADEMGLGKTIQMLGVILCNLQKRTLIVMPRALLEQWDNIIKKMTGHQVVVFHGEGKNIPLEELKKAPIVITTYGMVKKGKKKNSLCILHQLPWNRVIFDEAHHLRNKNTSSHKGALELKRDITWVVTGTPIQNRKSDFYSLCAIIGLPAKYYTAPQNLLTLSHSFMLKRTKEEVGVKLPKLNIKNIEVEWDNDEEKNIAEDIHSMLQFSRVNKINVDNAIAALGVSTLPLLVRARQSCVYPPLIINQLSRLVEAGIFDNDDKLHAGLLGESKIKKVSEMICKNGRNGHKKLVFCHYRGEIDILATKVEKSGMTVLKFDGRIQHNQRQHVLNSNCDVLIMQIQTGCEGLNLQQFSEIYFVSPHWNPAVEDQAIARCHRIGQEKEVTVYTFTMSGFDTGIGEDMSTRTIDEYSTAVQEMKRCVMSEIE